MTSNQHIYDKLCEMSEDIGACKTGIHNIERMQQSHIDDDVRTHTAMKADYAKRHADLQLELTAVSKQAAASTLNLSWMMTLAGIIGGTFVFLVRWVLQ